MATVFDVAKYIVDSLGKVTTMIAKARLLQPGMELSVGRCSYF